MMNARNEEMAEERDKKVRCNNIIIHRSPVSSGEEGHKKFVERLLMKFDIDDSQVKSIQRIGKVEDTGPIKLEMKTEEVKLKILRNLKTLKGDDEFNRIDITEDYTITERKLIQEYNAMAKQRTSQDPDNDKYIW